MNERMINLFSARGESIVKSSVEANKKLLRGRCADIRAELTGDYIAESSRLIAEQVLELDEYRSAETVFIYRSLPGEVSTDALIGRMLQDGKRLCAPLCLPEYRMEAKLFTADSEWRSGPFGIREPLPDAETIPPESIGFAIIPCVACDARCNRLGHGAGYYDRYLADTRFPKVAFCLDRLLVSNIRTYQDDVPMDLVITENRICRR